MPAENTEINFSRKMAAPKAFLPWSPFSVILWNIRWHTTSLLNLYNKVYPNHPNKAVHDRPYRTRDYGIWETEGKKVRLVREGK